MLTGEDPITIKIQFHPPKSITLFLLFFILQKMGIAVVLGLMGVAVVVSCY